jgi:hypothetical protein
MLAAVNHLVRDTRNTPAHRMQNIAICIAGGPQAARNHNNNTEKARDIVFVADKITSRMPHYPGPDYTAVQFSSRARALSPPKPSRGN